MDICSFISCLLFFIWICYWIFREDPIPKGLKEVPTESGLPLIGVIHKIKPTLPYYLKELGRRLGPIFCIKLGMRKVVVLNNYEFIRKGFVEDGINFSGRWKTKFVSDFIHDSGVLFTDGSVWATQRSFIMKVLRDFGIGRSQSIEIVQGECLNFINELDNLLGQKVNFSALIPIYSMNIISKFIMNRRYARNDPIIQSIEESGNKVLKNKDLAQFILLMFPVFDQSTWFAKFVEFTSSWRSLIPVQEYFAEEIERHRNALDFNSEGEDLMDRFLLEQHQLMQATENIEHFDNWQLIRDACELFIAGSETSSTTLTWSCLFMARHLDIQEKVHKEIVKIIGNERLPTMNDKRSLHYTQAVMDEILRLSSVIPITIMHRTLIDTNLNGYYIPKNSLVFPNLFACHVDPDLWENPMTFYPEHFLVSESDGALRYKPKKELIPFGMGKRQCIGESLARTEFFIFFASMIQKFRISFAEEITEEQYANALMSDDAPVKSCKINEFIFNRL